MKITADTNLLVRLLTEDDQRQHQLAERALSSADLVAITMPALCELVRVLSSGYGVGSADIASAIRRLLEVKNVAVDRPAVEAGLAMLDARADFADGVIAYQGALLGGETFLSFDRRAVRTMTDRGAAARLLS